MPIRYTISKDPRITYARYIGVVTLSELLVNYVSYIREDLYEPGIPELIDASDAFAFTANSLLLRTIGETVQLVNKNNVTTNTSIYAPTLKSMDAALRYQKICEKLTGIDVSVSSDEKSALARVELPYDTMAELKLAIGIR